MQVAQYTFQSPYASSVQIGKLDPSSVEKDKSSSSNGDMSALSKKVPEQLLKNDTQEVKSIEPTVSNSLLDTYA